MIQVESLRNDSFNLTGVERIRPTGYTSLVQLFLLLILSAKKGYSAAENTAIVIQSKAITFQKISNI